MHVLEQSRWYFVTSFRLFCYTLRRDTLTLALTSYYTNTYRPVLSFIPLHFLLHFLTLPFSSSFSFFIAVHYGNTLAPLSCSTPPATLQHSLIHSVTPRDTVSLLHFISCFCYTFKHFSTFISNATPRDTDPFTLHVLHHRFWYTSTHFATFIHLHSYFTIFIIIGPATLPYIWLHWLHLFISSALLLHFIIFFTTASLSRSLCYTVLFTFLFSGLFRIHAARHSAALASFACRT